MKPSTQETSQRGAAQRRRAWQCKAAWLLALLMPTAGAQTPAQAPPAAVQHLRIVGGLAGVNQFTRHEEPFWATDLARLSGGRYSAEIVPFDRAGIRAAEMLSLIRQGVVPFGTALLSASATREPDLGAADLAGLSPDLAALRRNVAAFRPYLEATLRARHNIELLAIYTYPAQVTFCKQPITGLASLAGRRVRTSGASQADWVEALGGTPVVTGFAEIMSNLRAGNIDCAITGTMSGHTIGLFEHTSHLHTMPVTWGLSVFGANSAAWAQLPAELKALIKRELPRVEEAIWLEADRETGEGIACNTGGAPCTSEGRMGRMTAVRESPADERQRREILSNVVLPRWLQRCGDACAATWNQTLAPGSGLTARSR
jgi:TRAP-type C4-dicarboxylate transport system substrate-binding protein